MNGKTKLRELLEQEGMTLDEFMREIMMDSISPGICMNDGCSYTTSVEPDCRHGWCECCNTNTVMSGVDLVLETGGLLY